MLPKMLCAILKRKREIIHRFASIRFRKIDIVFEKFAPRKHLEIDFPKLFIDFQ